MFRLVVTSINGGRYLIGSAKVAGLNTHGPVPSGEGAEFKTVQNARGYVRRELNGISSYCRAEVIDADGVTVAVGVRSGFNGTGRRFVWTDVEPVRDENGQPVLWSTSEVIDGHTYTGEITRHHFAGHGIVDGQYRWTVRFENEYRPVMASGVTRSPGDAFRAITGWVREFRARPVSGDELAVVAEVAAARAEDREISDACARVIGSWLAVGMGPGQSFASTGAIVTDDPSDLWHVMAREVHDREDTPAWLRDALGFLGTYLVARIRDHALGPVPGWSALRVR